MPRPRKPLSRKVIAALVIVAVFLLLPVLGGAFWYLTNLAYFRIGEIGVEGAALIPADDIRGAARAELAGRYWRVFPADFVLFVSGETLAQSLRERFSEIAEVGAEKRLPNRLHITIRERELWGVYCVRHDPAVPSESCFYVDMEGTAYEPLSGFEGSLLPIVYSAQELKTGERAVATETISFFSEAAAALGNIGLKPLALSLSTSTPGDGRLLLAEKWEVWISFGRPVEEWLGVLNTVLEKDIGARRKDLEYVDLRFGNKVFYKYR